MCTGCGDCVKTCPAGALTAENGNVVYDISKCINCDTCLKTCTHGSSPKIRYMEPAEVFTEIARQIPFIRGITVSGGECTLYPEFLTELFVICHEHGLETLLDSNGTLDFGRYPELVGVTDGVMLDIKAFQAEDHRKVTGCDNSRVLSNAEYLAGIGKLSEVRTVIVPDLFDTADTVRRTSAMLAPYLQIRDIRYKIIKYRPIGVRTEYSHYRMPDDGYLSEMADVARNEGMRNIIIT